MTDTDTRPRVAVSKPIDLEQLAAEVGAALSASETEVVVAEEDSAVTKAALAAAVKAHVPPPEPVPVAPLTDAEITAVRAHLAAANVL